MALKNRIQNIIQNIKGGMRMVFRALRGIGLWGTIQLILLRLEALYGGTGKIHKIRITGYSHPVFIRGGKSSDAMVLYQIFGVREYELATALDSIHFIMDAGANIGLASLYFLGRYPGARIMAVEPDPGNFEICRMNLEPYGDRAILQRGAVWSSCCHLTPVPFPSEWGLSVRSAKPGEDAPIEAFDIPSLMAAAGEEAIDLLKVDIEGSEEELFTPGSESWLRTIRNIAIEFHGACCERRFLEAMRNSAYRRIQRPMAAFFLDIRPSSAGQDR
jgi:FkbM family methyltransferase